MKFALSMYIWYNEKVANLLIYGPILTKLVPKWSSRKTDMPVLKFQVNPTSKKNVMTCWNLLYIWYNEKSLTYLFMVRFWQIWYQNDPLEKLIGLSGNFSSIRHQIKKLRPVELCSIYDVLNFNIAQRRDLKIQRCFNVVQRFLTINAGLDPTSRCFAAIFRGSLGVQAPTAGTPIEIVLFLIIFPHDFVVALEQIQLSLGRFNLYPVIIGTLNWCILKKILLWSCGLTANLENYY